MSLKYKLVNSLMSLKMSFVMSQKIGFLNVAISGFLMSQKFLCNVTKMSIFNVAKKRGLLILQ